MPFKDHHSGLSVQIRLTPNASRAAVTGLMERDDRKRLLKVSVTVPPEDGKANAALIALLAKEWGLPKSIFSLLSGQTNRQKVILIQGETAALRAKLAQYLENKGF